MRSFYLVLKTILCLAGVAGLLAGPGLARAGSPLTGMPPAALAQALNPDGTLKPGMAGTFDARRFTMGTAPDGRPVFRPKSLLGADDYHWQDGFGLPAGTNGRVTVLLPVGGEVYVGGKFTTVGNVVAHNLARWDGTAWHAVGTGLANGVGGEVLALARAANGDVYVGGSFSQAGGSYSPGIARWNGLAWSSLGTGTANGLTLGGAVSALAVGPGGEVYAGGVFSQAGGIMANNIAQWSGGSWSALVAGGINGVNQGVRALALTPAGELYVGGVFSQAGPVAAAGLARWSSGTWTALGSGLRQNASTLGYANALLLDATGNLYVGGRFAEAGGVPANNVARWNGTTWSALGSGSSNGVTGIVEALAAAPGGGLYAGGQVLNSTAPSTGVLRWNGSRWAPLGPGALGNHSVYVQALAVGAGGELYLGGQFGRANGVGADHIARWDGSIWQPLGAGSGNGLYGETTAVAVGPNGNVYVGGNIGKAGNVLANGVACWNGSSWSSLGAGTANGIVGWVEALAVAPNGDVYAGGDFSQAGGVSANNVARWNGTAWSALGSGSTNGVVGRVRALVVAPSGELYVGGQLTRAGGAVANGVARWNGTAWDALSGGLTYNSLAGSVRALALAPNGSLYVGGIFTRAGTATAENVARWNGTAWTSLNAGTGINAISNVYALAVTPNGDLYAGGSFGRVAGQAIYDVARWNGSTWSALGAGVGGGLGAVSNLRVTALAATASGHLYLGGLFGQAGGTPVHNLVRWDGSAWLPLGSGLNGEVVGLASDATGKLYVAGAFGGVGDNSKASSNFAIYDPAAVLGTAASAPLPALQLYPNPAHETVLLAGLPASAAPLVAVLRNTLGQVVRRTTLTAVAGQALLSVAGLPAGDYTLHLFTAQGPAVRRLVVE
ncbi:T9SS type A sorting domain-containing protein [Hymenobacter sp. ASUV-10]|uniref:T9SS type A sorting domain-containing protein n=1 Tax=Hymenobacter aranciens TaxID=3063996 RepID=A0ABT9BFI0_9BACT|nr:T9SS type A sorting domain-containing protein [Hymenobacter sp. ASUV-10]MDO7875411.1 T9SS type A sorting domain-containing protein [Hymenobacter sp. ASUV-10]